MIEPVKNQHDAGYHAILEAKYARIIEEISNMYSISLDEAMDMFYHSDTMHLMSYRIEVAPEFARRLKNLSKRSLH